ncbi:TPA: hypothetical protein ACG33R_001398 [Escherichia coli]
MVAMVSKLKQRRQRRLKSDVAWWKAEAADLYARVMEQADEIAALRQQVLHVPMPVMVPAEILQAIGVIGVVAVQQESGKQEATQCNT